MYTLHIECPYSTTQENKNNINKNHSAKRKIFIYLKTLQKHPQPMKDYTQLFPFQFIMLQLANKKNLQLKMKSFFSLLNGVSQLVS